MEAQDEKQIQDKEKVILEQYKIYSTAKENFIDRQFTNNRFYLVLNLIILVTSYVLSTLTPQFQPVIILSVIGFAITLMWWMSIDSYQTLIKIKYANVLEYLETKLPEQPYNKEYQDYLNIRKRKNLIVFGDVQKVIALVIACIYLYTFSLNIAELIKYRMMV